MAMRPATITPWATRAILTFGLLLLPTVGGGCIEAASLLRTLTAPPDDAGAADDGSDAADQPADNAQDDSADDQANDNATDNSGDDQADDADSDSGNDNSANDNGADAGPQPDDSDMSDADDMTTDGTPDQTTNGSEDTEGVPPLPDDAVLETSDTGVQTYDFVVGEGDSPAPGGSVRVAYTGYLERDGTIFDSNDSAVFNLNGVIAGFSEGILGMRVGGMRRIIIPPDQGYGASGNPNAGIGGEDVIIFDVELLEIP